MKAIIKLSSLGDIIHSSIVLPYLKEIDFIVDNSFAQILDYNPYINKVIPIRLREAKKDKKLFFKEFQKLKKLNYQSSIDMQGLIKSGIISKIISKKSIGFNDPREKFATLFYNQKIDTNTTDTIKRYTTLIETIYNLQIDPINHNKLLFYKDSDFITKEYFSKTKKNIIFIIGSTAKNRMYPIEKWVKLANKLNQNILISYGNLEEEKNAFYIAENSDATPLPKTDLNGLKATISNADLIIGNDTGPTYIGWANNIPTILLYGTTPISRIYQNKTTKIVKSKTAKYLDKLDKNDFSIKDIEIDEIMEKCDELFG